MIGFVTDRRRAADPSCSYLLARIRAAAVAGVDFIQIRERDLPDRDLIALVRRALVAASGTSTRILVNDRVDVALAAGAAGVHLRHDSADPSRVRAIVPPAFVIGRSIHDPAEAATATDCDLLLFGTVFASAGKPAGHHVAGLDALRAACAGARVPVLAIGGVDPANAPAAAAAGAKGVAAVGFFMADRPAGELDAAVRSLRAVFGP